MMMRNIFNQMEANLFFEAWFLKIGCILAFAIIANIVSNYLLCHARKASRSRANVWGSAFFEALKLPLIILIWAFGLKVTTDVLSKEFYNEVFNSNTLAIKITTIFCGALFLLRLINHLAQDTIIKNKLTNSQFDHTTIDALLKLSKLIVFVLTALIIIQNLGFSISAILAAGGAGGLVVGFAAKDLFANFFGGLTIYLDRPFSVGDAIRCDEKQIEGIVEYVGWRHTSLRASNSSPIYVPNSIFTTAVVENSSRMTNRKLNEVISLRRCDIDRISKITTSVRDFLNNNSEIDHEKIKIVNFDKLNNSSLDLTVQAFSKTTDLKQYYEIKQNILLKVAKIVVENGADFAFPTQTLYLEKS